MMPEVKFEEETYIPSYHARMEPKKGLTGLVRTLGLAKDERQAAYIVGGSLVLILIFVAIALMRSGVESRPAGPPTPLQEKRGF